MTNARDVMLNSLGLYNKNATILLLGLENAGKTTLMHMLDTESQIQNVTMPPKPAVVIEGCKTSPGCPQCMVWDGKRCKYPRGLTRDDRLAQHAPTQHATSEELQIAGVNFQAFDLGGHEIARKVWGDYFAKCDAVVYLVDSADRDRFGESRAELDALLSDDALSGVPFVVLGNKVDLPEAASEDEIRYALGLTNATTGKGKATDSRDSGIRPIEIYMCSVVRRMGFSEGFKWVAQYIK